MKKNRKVLEVKAIATLITFLVAFGAGAAETVNVVVRATDFGLNPAASLSFTLTPTGPLRRTYGTNMVTLSSRTLTSSANGQVTYSNTLWGNYNLTVPGNPQTIYRLTLGTNYTGSVSAAALVTDPQSVPPNPATNYYTQAQVDALVGTVGNSATNVYLSAAGTGITIVTNGLLYTISLYTAPSVSLANDQGTVEVGSTVSSTVLTWILSAGAITSQSLDNGIGDLLPSARSYTHASAYTTDRTYTLTFSDGTTTSTETTTVYFKHKRYWGVNAAALLTGTQVRALTSEFATALAKSAFSVSPDAQYIWYAYPAAWGAASFTVNGLPNTAWTLVTTNFVNASGNTTSFNLYRSDTVLTGTYSLTAY